MNRLLFFSFLMGLNFCHAQEWRILKIFETGDNYSKLPFFDDFFFSEIGYAKTDRNTDFFGLKGPVESVVQVSWDDSFDPYASVNLQLPYVTWEFDTCQHLTRYLDVYSASSLDSTVETFRYDDSGCLFAREYWSKNYQDYEFHKYFYDKAGYLVERIDSFSGLGQDYYSRADIKYNREYTKVEMKYTPLGELFWSFEDAGYTISYDQWGNYVPPNTSVSYDSQGRPVSYFINNGCGSNSALCLQVNIQYDDHGNVIECNVFDMTTRNSLWSFSSHVVASYNEHDLLSCREEHIYGQDGGSYYGEVFLQDGEFSSKNTTPVYIPQCTFEYELDAYGNWVTQDVYLEQEHKFRVVRTITYY